MYLKNIHHQNEWFWIWKNLGGYLRFVRRRHTIRITSLSPILRANDCRIAYVTPSQSQEGKLEIEILEAPPVYIGPDKESEKF
jgi:hypothetical protein